MLSSSFLRDRRHSLRERQVAIKPATVAIHRDGALIATVTARANYAGYMTRRAETEATDADIVSLTVVSDDPALDIERDDVVVCTNRETNGVTTGRVVAVRRESWGVEADATSEQ